MRRGYPLLSPIMLIVWLVLYCSPLDWDTGIVENSQMKGGAYAKDKVHRGCEAGHCAGGA